MYQKFNTHSKALRNRIEAHNKFGSKDLNQWIFDQIDVQPGNAILDIGCGRGKQSIDLAQLVGTLGKISSVDISEESISTLKQVAEEKKLSNINTYISDIDTVFDKLEDSTFNFIISSYALYYTKDARKMIQNIYDHLNQNGAVFFCGPSKQNNQEIKDFHYSIKEETQPPHTFASIFMEENGAQLVKEIFGNIEIFQFDNQLDFDSAESLYTYWSSYNLYDASIDQLFKDTAEKHFETNNIFTTTKRVIGVKATKN